MAKEQSAEAKLKYAAATVHTYESFGRAVVAAALSHAAKRAASGDHSAFSATVNVTPIAEADVTYFGGGSAGGGGESASRGGAGAGAAGPSGAPPVTLSVCFGDDCYVIIP
jgi:hypothetical protein